MRGCNLTFGAVVEPECGDGLSYQVFHVYYPAIASLTSLSNLSTIPVSNQSAWYRISDAENHLLHNMRQCSAFDFGLRNMLQRLWSLNRSIADWARCCICRQHMVHINLDGTKILKLVIGFAPVDGNLWYSHLAA